MDRPPPNVGTMQLRMDKFEPVIKHHIAKSNATLERCVFGMYLTSESMPRYVMLSVRCVGIVIYRRTIDFPETELTISDTASQHKEQEYGYGHSDNRT